MVTGEWNRKQMRLDEIEVRDLITWGMEVRVGTATQDAVSQEMHSGTMFSIRRNFDTAKKHSKHCKQLLFQSPFDLPGSPSSHMVSDVTFGLC